MSLISRLRSCTMRCCASIFSSRWERELYGTAGFPKRFQRQRTLPRGRGGFTPEAEDVAEPARTERLLARPLDLLPANGSDALESISLNVLSSGRGDSALTMAYDMGVFTVQLLLATFVGFSSALLSGSASAYAVVTAVLATQLSVTVWLSCNRPNNDRIANLNQQLSWAIEFASTGLLLLAALMPSLIELQLLALLIAMMSPAAWSNLPYWWGQAGHHGLLRVHLKD